MKKLSFLVVLILMACNSYGQSFEWEIINIGLPFGHQTDAKGNTVGYYGKSFSLGTEVRYNYLEKRVSSGIQFSLTGWNRRSPDGLYHTYHQNPFIFLAVTDYNFYNLLPKMVPFAGIGAGFSSVYAWSMSDYSDVPDDKLHFACSPRVGVEFFKRIRLTAEYQYVGNQNNFFNIKIGFVIGS